MTMQEFDALIGIGDGVALRANGVAALILPVDGQDDATNELVELIREVAATSPAVGPRVARRLAGVLGGADGEKFPAFGLVADAADGYVLFLFGPVMAMVHGAQPLELSGSLAATWVDRVLDDTVTSVILVEDGIEPQSPGVAFELLAGVVPAGHLHLSSGGAAPAARPAVAIPIEERPAPPPHRVVADPPTYEMPVSESAPPVKRKEPSEVISLLHLDPAPAAEAAPLPLADEPPVPAEVQAESSVEVQGILCSREHFNSPQSSFCSSCGISMVHQTHNLVKGDRPPLGFLVFDDGTTFTLNADYVLGRDPGDDDAVVAGNARPLIIDDLERTISRVHAQIRLVGWDVEVSDRGSTNGTFRWDDGSQNWQALPPHAPAVIAPGTRVAVGQRTFVFDTPHRVS